MDDNDNYETKVDSLISFKLLLDNVYVYGLIVHVTLLPVYNNQIISAPGSAIFHHAQSCAYLFAYTCYRGLLC